MLFHWLFCPFRIVLGATLAEKILISLDESQFTFEDAVTV